MNMQGKEGQDLSLEKKEQPQQHKHTEERSQQSIGSKLRQLRKEKGLDIKDIARETNISSSNLIAIEHENYTDLPAPTFIRGQVAIYANLMGLNGAEAGKTFVMEWERQTKSKKKQKEASNNLSVNKLSEPTHLSIASLIIGLVALFFLFIVGLSLYTGWNPFAASFSRDQQQSQGAPLSSSASLAPQQEEDEGTDQPGQAVEVTQEEGQAQEQVDAQQMDAPDAVENTATE